MVSERSLPDDDRTLVGRATAGEKGAFEQLYRRHVGPVYGLCLRMVVDRRRAEELTQDVFVRAWHKLATFRGDSAFGSWLHRLAVNVVLGEGRSRTRIERREEAIDLQQPDRRGPSRVSRFDLDRAIAALPPRAREVFVLFEIYGYRHGEIAAQLGISSGGCKAQLSRARRLLREALAS